MKKVVVLLTVVMFLFSSLAYARGGRGSGGNIKSHAGLMSAASSSRGAFGSMGPAPNSGDGIPDGSGFDRPNGPNGTQRPGSGNGPMGPAPNSGDCIPNGSGFDGPNGPFMR